MEAVVKSLDPNSNADRDAVLDSATEILGHIVDRLVWVSTEIIDKVRKEHVLVAHFDRFH